MLPEFDELTDGGLMLHYPLPVKDFKLVEDISMDKIIETED